MPVGGLHVVAPFPARAELAQRGLASVESDRTGAARRVLSTGRRVVGGSNQKKENYDVETDVH